MPFGCSRDEIRIGDDRGKKLQPKLRHVPACKSHSLQAIEPRKPSESNPVRIQAENITYPITYFACVRHSNKGSSVFLF